MTAFTTVWSRTGQTKMRAGAGRAAGVAGLLIAATVACAGYVVLLGTPGAGLLVVLGITSPATMRWCGRKLGRIPGRFGGGRALSTAELCRHWQDSFEALGHATTAAARLRIVEARQHCLDELERRDPIALKAWLGDNASAAGDPGRFLTSNGEDAA